VKVVDLADEFGLTTSEAIDACLWAGVPAATASTDLSADDAERVRGLIASWIDAGFAPWRATDVKEKGKGRRTSRAQAAASERKAGESAGAATGTLPATRAPGAVEPPPKATEKGRSKAPATRDATPAGAAIAEPSDDGDGAPPARVGGPLAAAGPGWLPGGPDAKARLTPLAIVALALAITSLVIPFITAVLAIVIASAAKHRIDDSRGWLKGTKLATIAQVIAGIGIGLWLVLAVWTVILQVRSEEDPNQAPDNQVDVETVLYSQVKIGDCVRLPKLGDITEWKVVGCDTQHEGQVFATLTAGNPAAQAYPGAAPIQGTATADCRVKLAEFTGGDTSNLEVGFGFPSRLTWTRDGDRTIWCVAFRRDGAKLVGTLKNNPQ
jgi:hypothetical protein